MSFINSRVEFEYLLTPKILNYHQIQKICILMLRIIRIKINSVTYLTILINLAKLYLQNSNDVLTKLYIVIN